MILMRLIEGDDCDDLSRMKYSDNLIDIQERIDMYIYLVEIEILKL